MRSYKDKNGNWLYPDEIEKISKNEAVKKSNKQKVIIGPPESMSKSKKNTIDPETMIKQFGADSVRWFILSDSPPEKDIQWSDDGVNSSNKFLQKIWNLNNNILNRNEEKGNQTLTNDFNSRIETLVNKIDKSIEGFKFNVSIAHFYETYNIFNKFLDKKISNDCLIVNITKIMKLLIPFTPHLAYECLELLKCKDIDSWPEIKENLVEKITFAVQVNGKTRDILSIDKDSSREKIELMIKKNFNFEKYIDNKKILNTIFVKNRIINYIIKDEI